MTTTVRTTQDTRKDREIGRLAQAQFGHFTRAQARAIGFKVDEVKRRLVDGRWVLIHDDVYRIMGAPVTWQGDVLAACWAGGPRSYASHRSAAALWNLAGKRTDIVEITCPRWRRTRHAGLVVHESALLAPDDVTVVDGIPSTNAERTILDLGAVCAPLTVEMALDRALRTEVTTFERMRSTLNRVARRGRNGAGVLRRILDERDPDHAPTESEMETMLRRVLRRNGLPDPVPQHEIWHEGRFVARVDFAYVDARIAIEYESVQEHTGRAALERDNPRRNAVIAAGWKPLGVTAAELRRGGMKLSNQIRSVLASSECGYSALVTPKR